MTRIVGGRAGGRRLTVPPTGTRPTSDRVREALFSAREARGLLEEHLRHCVAQAAADGGPVADHKLAEASAAIARLVRS